MECKVFKVCALGADFNAASVLEDTISLREPSGKSNGLLFVCHLKTEKAFQRKLQDYAEQNPGLPPFNKTAFTLELDGDGRWVHNLRYSGKSSVSNRFSFHLRVVHQFVGVKPKVKPVATPKRRRASDSGCDDSGSEADANP